MQNMKIPFSPLTEKAADKFKNDFKKHLNFTGLGAGKRGVAFPDLNGSGQVPGCRTCITRL